MITIGIKRSQPRVAIPAWLPAIKNLMWHEVSCFRARAGLPRLCRALKESTAMLKKTWGEQLVGNFSFGLIFFLLNIPAFILLFVGIGFGISAQSTVAVVACIGLAVIYFITLALVQSTLQSIFQAVLYLYAKNGQVPAEFPADLLQGAMSQR